jgi:NAD-dependent deacetylase
MSKQKIVVLSGAGVSAESGLSTFRDSGGLWEQYKIEDVCTPEAWQRNPALVLEFYNKRRLQAASVEPNPAHYAIAELEKAYDVTVITQNVDDLHERAGSSKVLHLHGRLTSVRSSGETGYQIDVGDKAILEGDLCPQGHQLRPDIVWFGEAVPNFELAFPIVAKADKVLVVGTSLSVYPAASLIDYAKDDAERVLVSLDMESVPANFTCHTEAAGKAVPELAAKWLQNAG